MWILWVIVGIFIALLLAAACLMQAYLKAFRRYDDQAFINGLRGEMARYAPILRRAIRENKNIKTELFSIRADDGETLFADLYRADGASKGTIILAHGFRSGSRSDFSCAIPLYHMLGWDLLLIDQRAQGRSSGRKIGLGVLERHDVAAWAFHTAKRLPGRPIFLDGISMGAATVMMACGLKLPAEVRGVIADCGFTSPYDIFHWLLKREGVPTLILPFFSLMAKPVLGYGLKDCSTLETLSHSRLPILLIHGEDDRFVPCEMSRRNYAASAAKDKTLVTVPGATHGMSFLVDPERCRAEITAFLARNSVPADALSRS